MKKILIESLPEVGEFFSIEEYEVIEVPMDFVERGKVRRKLKVKDLELLLSLPTGTALKPGTILHFDPSRKLVIKVVGKEEDVLVIYPETFEETVKVAHLLGNFHQPIDIDHAKNAIVVLFDPTLLERIEKLGVCVKREKRIFEGMLLGGHHH